MKKVLSTLCLICVCLFAKAQSADSTDTGKFSISGYIDSYYLTAFNNPKSGNLMGYGGSNDPATPEIIGTPVGRAFDRLANQFALGLVQTKFSYSNKWSDMVIDLTFGPNADLGNFGNSRTTALYIPGNTNVNALYNTSAAIKQAYFTYKATEKLSFTVGQFGTHIGYEVIDAPVNYNYSLSNLFNNGPFYHVGLKASYAFSDKVGLMVGLVNNWDNLSDENRQKSVISQLYLKPAEGWNLYLNYIGGYSDDTYLTAIKGGTAFTDYTRQLFDITTGYQLTSKFYVGLNAAYGRYSFLTKDDGAKAAIKDVYTKLKPEWGGVALYTNYAINDVIGVGVRYEHFKDKYFVRYIGATNNSLTITAPITLAGGKLQVKPELRIDTSPTKYYENSKGEATNSQSTLGAAFIYKF